MKNSQLKWAIRLGAQVSQTWGKMSSCCCCCFFFFFYSERCQYVWKKSIRVEIKTTLNNNTCTLCYPLCLQGNNHTSSHPKSLDTNKTQTAALLWFYFGCLFLNVYKDTHFHFLNVLKATVTSMLSWVSITSLALLQTLSPFSSSPLRGNKRWLAGIWSPGSDMEWMAAIAGTKQMRQSRTMAGRERTENATTGSRRGFFFSSIVKYNHPLFYMHTQGEFPREFIYMKHCKFSNFSDSLLYFWG